MLPTAVEHDNIAFVQIDDKTVSTAILPFY